MLRESIVTLLKEVYQEIFPKYPCYIIGKNVDILTGRAVFTIKAKRMSIPRHLKTSEIIQDHEYFFALSQKDRRLIEKQYLFELGQPQAYIEEHPIAADENNEYIFKIHSLPENKLICGSAAYFIKENKNVLSMLHEKDITTLAVAYYRERFGVQDDTIFLRGKENQHNIHYLL